MPTTASLPGSFRPGQLWLDTSGTPINAHGAGLLVHDGVTYWFGEHKIAGPAGNVAHVGVHVYRSIDLLAWEDAGIALAVSADPGHQLAAGCIIERPKVVFNRATGKFVMWFHWEPRGGGYSGACSGVAVADAPCGPYRFVRATRVTPGVWAEDVPPALRVPLTPAEEERLRGVALTGGPVEGYPTDVIFRRDHVGGQMARDMTIFVDDDGAAYHLFASEDNGTLHLAELSADFQGHSGRWVRLLAGGFHEAPVIFKRGGRYFLITSGCTGWAPNAARLSVADRIWGPWTELGNPCVGTPAQCATTFDAQGTYALPMPGHPGEFIFLADRWCPEDAIDGRYVWLPIVFVDGLPTIPWRERWDLASPFAEASP